MRSRAPSWSEAPFWSGAVILLSVVLAFFLVKSGALGLVAEEVFLFTVMPPLCRRNRFDSLVGWFEIMMVMWLIEAMVFCWCSSRSEPFFSSLSPLEWAKMISSSSLL
ncbi:hypothetical protein Bca101_087314 [Brassica carinata]